MAQPPGNPLSRREGFGGRAVPPSAGTGLIERIVKEQESREKVSTVEFGFPRVKLSGRKEDLALVVIGGSG